MARRVFTGWRTVTPGPCHDCGMDNGWYDCDGRGGIDCDCHIGVESWDEPTLTDALAPLPMAQLVSKGAV